MNFPKNTLYTKEHEWLKADNGKGSIGITFFAVEQMGDIVHIDFPKVGTKYKKGDSCATVESTKTVSDVYMPVDGTVTEINQTLKNSPEKITEDPYENGWIARITVEGSTSHLLDVATYEKYVAEEASNH